jgi:hypothetical protein
MLGAVNISDPVLHLPRGKARVVHAAIDQLAANGVIDPPTSERLRDHVQTVPFDWRRLARYAIVAAIACGVIAVGAVLADEALLKLLEKLFSLSWSLKAVGCAALSALLFLLGLNRRRRFPTKLYTNEGIFFCGVLGIAGSIACLGKAIDTGSGHYSLLIQIAAIVYGVLGILLDSKLIWTFSLLSLGGWFGAETGYVSGWGAYYLGMAYPLRFVLFGAALTAACLLMPSRPKFAPFFGVTRVMGLLYLFIALWILSIWGNYQGYESWHRATHFELFHWSIYFAAAAIVAIVLGLKNDDSVLRGFGLTFLGINLYTRFFEFFWDGLHKAIFFAILALTFWLIGSHAESIWNLRRLAKRIRD